MRDTAPRANGPLYSASFQGMPGEYDAEFHRLNAIIDGVARSMPEFAGVEWWLSWHDARGKAVYYGDLGR